MSIPKKSDSSSRIGKKVADLKQQLSNAEAQLQEKESKIESTVAADGNADKLFDQAGILRGNIESRRAILERVQAEYSVAVAREAREAKTAELDRFEKLLEKDMAGLETSLKDFTDAVEGLVEKEGAFEKQYSQLFSIPGPAGVNFRLLPNVDIGFITQAISVRLPANTPDRAIATANGVALSNLRSIRITMSRHIVQARGALDEEAASTPVLPPSEPSVTATAKKKVVDGGKELWRRQRKEALERQKSKGETDRDKEVRAEVEEMDREADRRGSGIPGSREYVPMSQFTK